MISLLIECLFTKFHQVPIKTAQVMAILRFCYSNFLVGWVGRLKNGSLSNVTVACGCVKGTCILNFSLIGKKLRKLSHIFTFGQLVGWAGL